MINGGHLMDSVWFTSLHACSMRRLPTMAEPNSVVLPKTGPQKAGHPG